MFQQPLLDFHLSLLVDGYILYVPALHVRKIPTHIQVLIMMPSPALCLCILHLSCLQPASDPMKYILSSHLQLMCAGARLLTLCWHMHEARDLHSW